jgi:hypothetical protein
MESRLELSNYINSKYGNIYTKSGKGKTQVGGMRVNDFAKKLLGNRILDLYLKYTALKTLNSATMVPIAFIMGRDYLKKILNQTGGGDPIPSNIPLFDHPLIGLYLKMIGLTALDLTTGTLIPLGSLMIMHDLYTNNVSIQDGGARTIYGNSVPPNIIQNIDTSVRGQGIAENTIMNRFPEWNSQLQLACNTGNCSPNVYSSYKPVTPLKAHVNAFPSKGISNSMTSQYWSGDLGVYNRVVQPSSMAGGGLINNYDFITHPNTGKSHNINSKSGQTILKNYLKTFK